MEERQRNIAVGGTAILGLAGLLLLLLLFGYVPEFIESSYIVTVKLPDAGGLHSDSRVTLRGINIGRIENIELQPPPNGDVRVVVKVLRKDVKLPVGTYADLESALLGGGTTLSFNTDRVDWAHIQYLPRDGSALIEGEAPLSVGRIARELRGALTEPMEQFREVSAKMSEMATSWTEVGRNLKGLSVPQTLEDVDSGLVSANLSTVFVRADARLVQLREVLQGIDRYVNNDQIRGDLTSTLANTRRLSEQVTESIDKLVHRYMAVADDLSATVSSIQELLIIAQTPDGTLGKMIMDSRLYDNLNDSAERLGQAIEEVQLLFEKWKAEGVELQF